MVEEVKNPDGWNKESHYRDKKKYKGLHKPKEEIIIIVTHEQVDIEEIIPEDEWCVGR